MLTSRRLALQAAIIVACIALIFFSLSTFAGGKLAAAAAHQVSGNSSVGLLLCAGALALRARARASRLAVALAALGAAIGVVTFHEYLAGVDLGIDNLLVPGGARMSPNAAVAFILIGAALALAGGRTVAVRFSQALAILGLVVGVLALVGYLYDASFLYQPTHHIRITPWSAAALVLVAGGTVVVRPDAGIARLLSSAGPGGYVMRRLLIVIVVLPVVFGYLFLEQQELGLFSPGVSMAILVLSVATVLVLVVILLARSLDQVDARRDHAEASLERVANLTSVLAQAATVDEVVEAAMTAGLPALGAVAGDFLLLSEDGKALRVAASRGRPAPAAHATLPVEASLPATDALRSSSPVFLPSTAALPLKGRERTLGVLALDYDAPQPFDDRARERALRLAWHCGQALDRALLVESERAARARADAAGAAGAVGTFALDVAGGRAVTDPFVARTLGLPIDTTVAEFFGAVFPEDRPALERALRGDDSTVEAEVRARGSDGQLRWLAARGVVERDAEGRPERWVGALADISRGKDTEEQLRRSEREKGEARALLDSIFATAPVGLAFIDLELRFVRVNPMLAELTGIPEAEHAGKRIDEVVGGELGGWVRSRLQHIIDKNQPVIDAEHAGWRAGGRPTHWLASYYPVPGPEGRVLGIGAVVLDITERKRGEQRAHRLQALTAGLADLKDPELASRVVVEQAVAALDAESGALHAGTPRLLAQDTPLAECARTGAPVVAGAVVALPLQSRAGIPDVLALRLRQARELDFADADLLRAVALQCAHALERVRLHAAERDAATRLRVLAEASRAFARETELEGLLDAVARVVGQSLDSLCRLELLSPDGARLEETAVHHAGADPARRPAPLALGEDPAERTAAVTLRNGAQPIGELMVARDRAYRGEDQMLLEDLGERAAMAITSLRRRLDAEAQRARLAALFMQAPAIISITRGPEHVFELSNPRHRDWRGGRDVVGLRAADVVADPALIEILDRVYLGGEPFAVDALATVGESGATRYLDWVAVPLRDELERVEGVMSFAQDVTDKVLAQRAAEAARAALADTEERLRLAVHGSALGIFDWRVAERTLRWDERTKELFGLPVDEEPSEVLFFSAIHPDDRARVEELLARAREPGSGGAYDTELRVVGIDDRVERWLRVTGQCFFDGEDRPDRLVGTVTDISAQKRAALQLRAAGERLRAALEAAAIGTYYWDIRGDHITRDVGVTNIFGLAAGEGDDLERLTQRIHPDDRAAWQAALEQSRREGTDLEMRFRVVLPGGGIRWVLDKGQTTRDEAGRPLYLTGAVVDLTAEMRAREEAEAASKAKDEFLAMLGHELRNPLSPMLTALQLMKLRAGDTLEKERAIIERQVQHMVRLVDDLLDVSRITRGKIELKRRRVELSHVVAQAVELASPLLEKRMHRLTIVVPAHGLPIFADSNRLAQVVSNLLTNAAKFTDPGGEIVVQGRRRDRAVTLEVRDTGIGIAPELLPRVFDHFVQGHRSIDRSQGGLGLGLALVKTLVEMHGGAVQAASDGPGQGSVFTIALPQADFVTDASAASSLPSAVSSPIAAIRPRRVLVVDDNRDAADTLAEGLRLHGHEVTVAYDGPTALESVAERGPELAFLDIGLPVMDGYELARRLREQHPGPLTLVALTGYGQEADRARSVAAGFDRHLVKPIPIERTLEIAATLRR